MLDEVTQANQTRRDEILAEISVLRPGLLEVTDEVEEMAQTYLAAGVLPESQLMDALHVALATVSEMDVLVSWNQKHLLNIRRRDHFNNVNRLAGYRKELEIATPLEVLL